MHLNKISIALSLTLAVSTGCAESNTAGDGNQAPSGEDVWTDEEGNVGKASCFTREFSCSLYKDEGSSKVGSRSSLKEGMIGKKPIGEDSSPLTNKNLAEVKCGALYADNENARFSVKDEYRFTGEFEQDW